jgi:hypothetical protein
LIFTVVESLDHSDSIPADAIQEITQWTMKFRNQSHPAKVPASAI